MGEAIGPKLGILVGGGPAPGINGVIAAATIEARNRGVPVVGILDGFRWLAQGRLEHAQPLEIADVSRIHFRGGSILRTSRTNPTRDPGAKQRVLDALRSLGIGCLVSIGGDDTAFTASQLAREAGGSIRIVHVPKTIDNDLPLPGGVQTFGFETARHVGVSIVEPIMEDARATSRWYLLVAMGRKAGHLALGIGKAASATLTLIPEEFPGTAVPLSRVADIIEGSIVKRLAMGQENGVAVIAEGVAECLDPADLTGIETAERDDHGHVRLSELPLGEVLKSELRARLSARGLSLKIVAKDIGYELRCADPIPFDAEYTRDLGYGAARYVLEGGSDAMITRQSGRIAPLPFSEMLDPSTGRPRLRLVDTSAESYEVARKYMIRLSGEDVADPGLLKQLAESGRIEADELRARYADHSA